MSGGQVFVDETKRRDYLLIAAVVLPDNLDPIRRALRALVLPGQRRLHMKDESDPRKRAIATAIATSEIQATIYDAGRRYRTERDRRAACLQAIVRDAASRGNSLLVLDRDDSLLSWDNQHLIEVTREADCRETLRYVHRKASDEPLLAVPDAIAWCWARGGHWRSRVASVVDGVRRV